MKIILKILVQFQVLKNIRKNGFELGPSFGFDNSGQNI